jgi:hypothetical protein
MIYININIRNPWSSRFENVINRSGAITKNKSWEIELLKTDNMFRLEFQFTIMQDHAGLGLELGLLGWELHIGIHDNRHWNYTDKCWEIY